MRIIKYIFSFLFSTLYATWLSLLPFDIFKDRGSYLLYAEVFQDKMENISQKGFIIFNEPLFLYINQFLYIFGNPFITVGIIIFFTCFYFCFFSLIATKNLIIGILCVLFCFLNTQSLGLQLVTIRQGLALSFLMLWLPFLKNRIYFVLFLSFLGLIHTSFYIFAFFVFAFFFLEKSIKINNERAIVFLLTCLGLVVNVTVLTVSKILQTKQDYAGFESNVGGGAFVYWLLILMYILLFKPAKTYPKDSIYPNIRILTLTGLIIYLTGYFLSPISGRLVGGVVPFAITTLFYKVKWMDIVFISLIFMVSLKLFFSGTMEGFLTVPFSEFLYHLFNF